MKLARRRLELLWLVLVAATCASWWLGAEHAGDAAALGVIAIAFVKVWLVGFHYMELGNAPKVLLRLFEAYVVIVPIVLGTLYLTT